MKQIERLYSPISANVVWAKAWFFGIKDVCKRGNLPIAEWLLKHPIGQSVCRLISDEEGNDLLPLAAAGGHVPIIALLLKRHAVNSQVQLEHGLVSAIRNGHLPAVGWLLQHYRYPVRMGSACAIGEAIKHGRLDILKYFHRLRSSTDKRGRSMAVIEAWWTRAGAVMSIAAKYGHLDVLKWLHLKYPGTCSSKAMDDAATNGHLNVVQWLHANRSEGCTRRAMNGAAANGHLEVFQWLQMNTSAECTTHAMDLAAGRGQLNMLKWLHIHRSERFTVKAIDDALEQSHLRILSWLHCNAPQLTPSKDRIVIHAPNQFDVLLFLYHHFPQVFGPESSQRPIVGFICKPNESYMTCWLQEQLADGKMSIGSLSWRRLR
ncbi:hypothetical protein PHMEG_00034543 [Phytophthora megakarya]|uniref:Uncharacterized protein n=1 Tax=Phytophthora megakarya TaxID=4795 RepID=A0A225UR79_9STRA|nr:hypothetical protein PHMEG_00034543 [Phytophthora megakarya]